MTWSFGARVKDGVTRFAVRSPRAAGVVLCLFDGDREERHTMQRDDDGWSVLLPNDLVGARYGFRAHGEWAPERGLWFDPAKLLVDPYAVELDRRFLQRPELASFGADSAPIIPKAIVPRDMPDVPHRSPLYRRGGLIYELNVRAFTILHPDVPEAQRGTVAALAHPAVLAHLKKLHVSAVELMPVVAWIDERHLPPLGLVNAWGYNPVAMMALDPGICPGGVAELRGTVTALHEAGIGVILDIVLNHSGESDVYSGILSLRGLDDAAYAHEADGSLTNVTGTGNTLDFGNAAVRRLALDTLRHFVRKCGVDGFRFDLATVLARAPEFNPSAPIFMEIAADEWLADRVMIAEPWDIGPGGYCLGQFPSNWLEWNDRYRDDVRRFWRGDVEVGIGQLATRVAGSSDIFGPNTRTVNFLSTHDGMTLADVLAYSGKNNEANGEGNRDGHCENYSWNCGAEGQTDDPNVKARRQSSVQAMLVTLFGSSGSIMLTAGDEFGRSQLGNNNAYCQDNEKAWSNWIGRDTILEDFVAGLAETRARHLSLFDELPAGVSWTSPDGIAMRDEDWDSPKFNGFILKIAFDGGIITLEISRDGGWASLKLLSAS